MAARVLKPCSDLDVFPLTISKGGILLPAEFTQAMTVMLVRQDDVRPTTVLEPFSAIIRTGWCSKLFPVSSKFHMHEGLDTRSRFHDYFSKIMKIFSYLFRVCHSCLVVLSISGLRIESVGCHFRKPANQSFPGFF